MINSDQFRESLARTDAEFRYLSEQHQELDSRISQLSRQPYRSDTEELEEGTLKKRKLQLKDQMARMIQRRRELAARGPSTALQTHPRS